VKRRSIVAHSLIVVVVLLSLATSAAQAAPMEGIPNLIAIAGSPLRIEVGSNMSIQVYHQNYEHGATYGDADSGPFWYINGQIYGPNMPNYGDSASFSSTELTWTDHQGPSGSGTAGDPWRVQTRGQLGTGAGAPAPAGEATGSVAQPGGQVSAGASALEVTQLISYVNGRNYFQLDWTMANRGGSQSCFKFYHAADIYFANSDYGYGYYDTGSGSVGGYDEGRTWFMVFAPITRADQYKEAYYGTVWDDVKNGRDLDNTLSSEYLDNGIGLQWNICLAAGESKTISDVWSFGHSEAEVIPTELARTTPQGPAAVDVMVRDHINDNGSVPSNPNGEPFWMSPDIIVRHEADGQTGETDFQNPTFGQTNYVYVTVRNIGTQDASNVTVNVYWGDPALLLAWPDSWHLIGATTVDVPAGGQAVTPEIAWSNLPSPGHRCLLVRLVTDQDPITNEGNVPGDNNIAQRNLHILDMPRSAGSTTGSEDVEAIVVGPPNADTSQVDLVVQYPDLPQGAELVISMAGDLFDRWMQATNGDVVNGTVRGEEIVATGPDETTIRNLPLTSGEQAPITIRIEAPTADPFSFQVTERVNGADTGGNVYWYTALLPKATPETGAVELPKVELPSELTCTCPCTGAILLTVLVLWLIRR
jgi:hypothetical protein